RILPRHQSDPGREIASRPEDSRVRHSRHDRSRPDNPDARDRPNPLARLARAMLHLDPLFDRSDDTRQRFKLRSQHDDADPCIDRCPSLGLDGTEPAYKPRTPPPPPSSRLSGCGTNGCLARLGNSRSPTFPQPRARPVIQGVVDNGYALIVFWQQYRNSAVQWLASPRAVRLDRAVEIKRLTRRAFEVVDAVCQQAAGRGGRGDGSGEREFVGGSSE